MSFFSRASGGTMMFAKNLPSYPRDLLTKATYQHVASPQGTPQVKVELRFSYKLPSVINPHMALGLLLDRSGSMTETYRDGHVFNAANAVLQQVGPSGFDLAFYDTHETIAGQVGSVQALQTAVRRFAPNGGGTTVFASLRAMISRLQARKPDVYVIVVTDGEFSDKVQVQSWIVNQLLPSLPPNRPNALRLHFVGAGGEVDHQFLKQLENDVANKGVPLVRQHHHEHLSRAHADITDELGTIYIGAGIHGQVYDQTGLLHRAGLFGAGPLTEGSNVELPFLPRNATLAFEYGVPHPGSMTLPTQFVDGGGAQRAFTIAFPLPAVTKASAPGRHATAPGGPVAGAGAPKTAAAAGATPAAGSADAPGHAPVFAAPSLGKQKRKYLIPGVLMPESAEEQAERVARKAYVAQVREAEMRRQSADLKDLAMGGIPSSARKRLSELKTDPQAIFTSDLAPDEIALLRSKGVRSRGLVTGSAMYHVGTAYASSTGDCEVRVLSDAYNEATRLAVSRMEQEVHALGAHGAVGVRLTMTRREWADKTIEVQLIGTAVESPGAPPARPWLSDLSGQEWWALQRAGYDPVGIVWGHCTWFVLTTPQDEWVARSWSNTELTHYSAGISRARHIAMNGLTARAKAYGANGVAGMHLSRHMEEVRLQGSDENPVYEYEHHNVTLSLIGTAVRLRADAPARVVETRPIMSLRDHRIVPAVIHAASADFE